MARQLRPAFRDSRHAICTLKASGLNFRRRSGSILGTDMERSGRLARFSVRLFRQRRTSRKQVILMMFSNKNKQRPLRLIVIIASLAFIGIAMVAAMQAIHPAPAAPTLRQDQAELARLESESDARIDVERPMTPTPAVEEPATAVSVPPKEESPVNPAQSKAVASRGHRARTSRSKRYQERQAELAFQRQRAIAASQYRYAQQESGSFFGSIAHALGLGGR